MARSLSGEEVLNSDDGVPLALKIKKERCSEKMWQVEAPPEVYL